MKGMFFYFLWWLPLASPALADHSRSVVQIFVTKQKADMGSPWKKKSPYREVHLGVFVAPHKILTSSFAVNFAKVIEMRRLGAQQRVSLKVVRHDPEVNLALLEVEKPLAWVRPLTLGNDLALGSQVNVLKNLSDRQLISLSARLTEFKVLAPLTSSYRFGYYKMEIQRSGLGWSEPVIKQGRLVGLTTGQDKEVLYVIPSVIIKHFLAEGKTYRGFPSLGVFTQDLRSETMRRYLKVGRDGIRVAKVYANSPFVEDLKEDDVIRKLGQHTIGEQGFTDHPIWGKVHYRFLLNQKFAGDRLTLTVDRGGKTLTFQRALTRYRSNDWLVPYYRTDDREPFVLFAGLIFQELTRPYLRLWGKGWQDKVPEEFGYTWLYLDVPPKENGQRAIFLNRVLSDRHNRGYHNRENHILQSVNGQTIHTLADVKQALRKPINRHGQAYAHFRFRGAREIILSYQGLVEAHQRISQRYGVRPEFFSAGLQETSGG